MKEPVAVEVGRRRCVGLQISDLPDYAFVLQVMAKLDFTEKDKELHLDQIGVTRIKELEEEEKKKEETLKRTARRVVDQ